MNYLNDSNWTGRIPRRLCESKWGANTRWDAYDNTARPGVWDIIAIAAGAAMLVLFCFIGSEVFA